MFHIDIQAILPKYCLGCSLISDNKDIICSSCKDNLLVIKDRCYRCLSHLYEEFEHVLCSNCEGVESIITKSYGLYSHNGLTQKLINVAIEQKSRVARMWLIKKLINIYPSYLQIMTFTYSDFIFINNMQPNRAILIKKNHRHRAYKESLSVFVSRLDSMFKVEKKLFEMGLRGSSVDLICISR